MINNKTYEQGSQEWLLNQIRLEGNNSGGSSSGGATESTQLSIDSNLSDIKTNTQSIDIKVNEVVNNTQATVSSIINTSENVVNQLVYLSQLEENINSKLEELNNKTIENQELFNQIIKLLDKANTRQTSTSISQTLTMPAGSNVILPINPNRIGFQIQPDGDCKLAFASDATSGFLLAKNQIFNSPSNVTTISEISIFSDTGVTVQIIEY